jgi:endonuclease-8
VPEGHTVHRNAREHLARFGGTSVRVTSPQGRFADGAALVDGRVLDDTEAHGKHLFLGFDGTGWVHVHLGLYGKFTFGRGPAPAPVGQVRLRISTDGDAYGDPHGDAHGDAYGDPHADAHGGPSGDASGDGAGAYADLRGPTRCELITDAEKQAVEERLGPDPLRADADPEAAWSRISRSRTTVAALLMDQKIVAGVGNVYRAEVLHVVGLHPLVPADEVTRSQFD